MAVEATGRPTADREWPRLLDAAFAIVLCAVGAAIAVMVLVGHHGHSDPLVFLRFGEEIEAGKIPYRDFHVEYPPLALLPLALPFLAAGPDASPDAYQTIFSLLSLAFALVTGACVWTLARRGWSASTTTDTLLIYAGMSLAMAPLIIWRFDIFPAMFSALALVATASGWPLWAGVALGLGAAVKLYPAFLAPVLAGFHLARRRVASAVLVVIGSMVAFGAVVAEVAAVVGPSALSFLTYQEDRGFEVESTFAGVVLLAHVLFGTDATIFLGFGSFQVASPLVDDLAFARRAFEAVLILALVTCGSIAVIRDLRHDGLARPATLVRFMVATLLAVLLINKAFSPQYMVWLLPFAVLLPRPQVVALFMACVLTTLVYPVTFDFLLAFEPLPVLVLNARNLLLVGIFVWLLLPSDRERVATPKAEQDLLRQSGAPS